MASRIHSFHMHLCYLGPILFPGSPYGVVDVEKAASCLPLAAQQSPWRVEASADPSLGALTLIWRPEIADGCDISCLSIWQEIFSFHHKK